MNKLMIIDGNNLFVRNFVVNPAVSPQGQPVGGVYGFLRSLQALIRQIDPSKIVIIWDGFGGSRKRKLMNKQYKAGRKAPSLNRFEGDMDPVEIEKNQYWQLSKTTVYLDNMPVHQLVYEAVEADDVIAAVAQLCEKEYQIVIVSSDKDFLQLINKQVILYRPAQKEILNVKRVSEKYGIHPNNFVLARAMVGDKSDNINGLKSVGLQTVAKRFPFLLEEKTYDISDILAHAKKENIKNKKLKIYPIVLEGEKIIKNNYDLMQLTIPNISVKVMDMIKQDLKEKLVFKKTEIVKMLIKDGASETNWDTMFAKFRYLIDNQ